MTAVFSAPDAAVLGSVLVLIGTLAGLFMQNRRTHRENRSDHADTAAKVDQLLKAQGVIGADVADVKADVIDVKAEVRDHGQRLRALEQPATPRPRKKAAS
jgi:hypothetical protein